MPAPIISTADAKSHLRVFHTQDDSYIGALVTAVVQEWELVTHFNLTPGASHSHVYTSAPDDGVLRVYHHPVDTSVATVEYTDASGVAVVAGDPAQWVTLDGYSQYTISDAEASAWVYPITLTYTCESALPAAVKQALLLRIGYYYSYRGDDVQVPDVTSWQMLAARYRTGALL